MKRYNWHVLIPIIIATFCVFGSQNCAGAKVNLVKSYQGIETALAAVDDAERLLCWNTTNIKGWTKAQLATCTNPNRPANLTDKAHQEIQARLIDAFNAQTRLGPVIQKWTVNTPPPDLNQALGDANAVVVLIRAITPKGQWIEQALDWAKQLTAIVNTIKGSSGS